jgi:hypothetical protein
MGNDYLLVNSGIYKVNNAEYYLHAFYIQTAAKPCDSNCYCDSLRRPTREEYLVAARNPKLVCGKYWEYLGHVPESICDCSADLLEAEGICGLDYFAGLGKKSADPNVIKIEQGGSDPRTTIISTSAISMAFYGEEMKPGPRAVRYVKDSAKYPDVKVKLSANGVTVRTGRGEKFPRRMTMAKGTALSVIYKDTAWVFIEADGSHGCNKDPQYDNFRDCGWVKREFVELRKQ